MTEDTAKQILAQLQEQTRSLQLIIAWLEKIDGSVHQVFLK